MKAGWQLRRDVGAWLYLAPALLIVGGIVGYPLGKTFYLSLTDTSLFGFGSAHFVGLANFAQAVRSQDLQAATVHTLYFVVLSLLIEVPLGVLVALLLNQKFKGRALVRTLVIIPWAVPTVVNAVMWQWIYNPSYGALNALLTQWHIIDSYQSWLGSPDPSTMLMVVLADAWKNYPIVTILVLAALQAVPEELYEAAKVDGANAWQRFWKITLPNIRPALLVALVLRTIDGVKVFDIIYLMTRGGPASTTKTLSFYVYDEAFGYLHLGLAAAYAVITVLIIAVFIFIYIWLIRSRERAK